MNHLVRFATAFALAAAALSAQAQEQPIGTSAINASSGSVAAASSSGGDWKGLTGSAKGATISFDSSPITDDGGVTSSKFATASDGTVSGTGYGFSNGFSFSNATAYGVSTVSTPSNGAPTYYDAPWAAQAGQSDDGANETSIGTYDPYTVHRSDLSGLGSTVDLYYQTALLKSYGFQTGVNPQAGQIASYGYDVSYVLPNGDSQSILSIDFSSVTGLSLTYFNAPGLQAYVLDPNKATDPSLTPDGRAAGATLLTSSNIGLLGSTFDSMGSLSHSLYFGVFYRNFAVGTGSPDDELLSWHTDTFNSVGTPATPSVPGPLAALPFALGILKRRRK